MQLHKQMAYPSNPSEAGFTLIELLVTLLISSVLFGGMMLQYSEVVSTARDHQIRIETLVEAQAIVQTLATELRMIGNGVPFDQANFEIGESTLSDPTVTEPIVVASTTATNLVFRLNESGEVLLLTANFDPSVSLEVFLSDVSQFAVNDPIYISNSVVAGDEGLSGTVASVNSGTNSIVLAPGYITTAGAVFPMGSILEEVPTITYTSASDGSGIIRDTGFGPVQLGLNSTLNLDYLDYAGNSLALPLTTAALVDSLRSIRITVTKTSEATLSSGTTHSVSVSQIVGIRNLNLLF